MANTRETLGEQACLDALVSNTLTSFEDDGVTKVGSHCLSYHTALTDVTLPQCKAIDRYGLSNCTNLEVVDMLGTGTVGEGAFMFDAKLKHLILRGSSMTSSPDSSTFNRTPILMGEGAIYVQQELLATYKANSGWMGYTILPISQYPKHGLPETISDSWSEIIAASANGTYSSKYAVGDVKSMDIGGTTYYFQLVAMGADVLASDGTTTVPMTWLMFKKYYGTIRDMNSTATTAGGWEASAMRSWLSNTVLPLIPTEVQAAIKEVRKYSDTYGSAIVHDQTTSDKLWIPSAREMFGGSYYEQTGPIYSEVFYNARSRIKYDQSGFTNNWWLRSTYSDTIFRRVGNSGDSNSGVANAFAGVVLGFSI